VKRRGGARVKVVCQLNSHHTRAANEPMMSQTPIRSQLINEMRLFFS
jgi:hypothetical protein